MHDNDILNSLSAERIILATLLTEYDTSLYVDGISYLTSNDFFDYRNKCIFQAIEPFLRDGEYFDIIKIQESLKCDPQWKRVTEGDIYLIDLSKDIVVASHLDHYIHIVRSYALMRSLVDIANFVLEKTKITSYKDVFTLVDSLERQIFNLSHTDFNFKSYKVSSLIKNFEDDFERKRYIENVITGLPTPYQALNHTTSGFQAGDLIVIAGRPSMGKTSFSMNLAEYVAVEEKKAVLIFNMEMSKEMLFKRLISSIGKVELSYLQSPASIPKALEEEVYGKIRYALDSLETTQIYIDDSPVLTPLEIRSKSRRIMRENPSLSLIVMDYLQLIHAGSNRVENKALEIAEISRSMKNLARELNVSILLLSQLNRNLELRQNKMPIMSDLRDSGSIEQDADLILFLYRDEVYNHNSENDGMAEIKIAKNRNGPIGEFYLRFEKEYSKFVDI